MSGLNTTLWYMLWHKSDKNYTGEYFLRYHFPPRVIKYRHTECNNPFVVVFRECWVLIFVKYDLKIPSDTFERFITQENYNVMKRYLTGSKHFRDPVLENEYNSFASQSYNPTPWCFGRWRYMLMNGWWKWWKYTYIWRFILVNE